MTDSPRIALVKRAIGAWEDIDWFIEHIGELCTDDLEWFNAGLATTHGLDDARKMLRGFKKGFKGIEVEYLSVIEVDDRVWTERVDYMIDHAGNRAIRCPDMGIFEFRGDKICSWRDYFDASPFKLKPAAG